MKFVERTATWRRRERRVLLRVSRAAWRLERGGTVVVLGEGRDAMEAALAAGSGMGRAEWTSPTTVRNPDPGAGLSSSLRIGLEAGAARFPDAVAALVLLGVPDTALAGQLSLAAARGDRSAVIFGGAYEIPDVTPGTAGLRSQLAGTARSAGMAVCGAGCMGFVNVCYGLRAIGYIEPDPLPAGPVALITASGSVFSALLRARRGFGFTGVAAAAQ